MLWTEKVKMPPRAPLAAIASRLAQSLPSASRRLGPTQHADKGREERSPSKKPASTADLSCNDRLAATARCATEHSLSRAPERVRLEGSVWSGVLFASSSQKSSDVLAELDEL